MRKFLRHSTPRERGLSPQRAFAVPGGTWAGDWGLVVLLNDDSKKRSLKCLNCVRGDCRHCKIFRGFTARVR